MRGGRERAVSVRNESGRGRVLAGEVVKEEKQHRAVKNTLSLGDEVCMGEWRRYVGEGKQYVGEGRE